MYALRIFKLKLNVCIFPFVLLIKFQIIFDKETRRIGRTKDINYNVVVNIEK